MDKQKILNKYTKPDDKLLISKMIDKIELTSKRNKLEYSDFLDVYQKQLIEKILITEKINNYIVTGIVTEAERNIIIFYPEKLKNILKNEYDKILPIKIIRIKLPKQLYNKYNHRDYLGGLIKLGIKREKIGDILVFEDGADILVLEEISKFLLNNLNNLTRFNKSIVEEIQIKDIREKKIKKKELNIIVSSMRLDCIIPELLKTSRGKAEEVINDSRVFVNFENVDKQTRKIKEKDIIVIRGKGKFEINNIEGNTKNGRMKINVNKFV